MSPRTPATPADAALSLARKECRSIQRALSSRKRVHESIHSARKAIRRLRALLQLVEARVEDLAAADRILRRTGDSLSALRDAHVAIATAARLAAGRGGARWEPVVTVLVARRDVLLDQALAADPGFRRRRSWVERAAQRLEAARWDDLTHGDLRRGLERGRRRADKARTRATRKPTTDNLHRWRRRVRKLRMQMLAASRVAPDLAGSRAHAADRHGPARALHKLSDLLGQRQDLDVLRDLVRHMPGLTDRHALLEQLRDAEAKLSPST